MKDARSIINFIKTPIGKFVMLFIVLLFIMVISPFLRSLLSAEMPKGGNYTIQESEGSVVLNPGKFIPGSETTNVIVRNDSEPDTSIPEKRAVPNVKTFEAAETKQQNKDSVSNIYSNTRALSITPLDLYTAKSQDNSSPMTEFAPYGRLIPCELINTIDSANTETPIIGLVTEDVYNEGKLIIPSGTEVHGTARSTPIRDHIATSTSWILVWRSDSTDNGLELKVKGIALEDGRIAGSEGKKWSITDGSAGIKGYTIDNRSLAELKAIALKMLAGMGQGMYKNNIVGMSGGAAMIESGGTWADSLGKGLEQSADLYADIMLSHIMKDGFFVRCPAGSTFYLYVEQTIDMRKASIAGSRVDLTNNNEKSDEKVFTSQEDIYPKANELEQKKEMLLKNYPGLQ
ncbi:MAG TPA: hypothetical protein DD381_13280 [Lentisphaeria bacterium]|nr:hypothetical protein [Lentisphaeria bacterium]